MSPSLSVTSSSQGSSAGVEITRRTPSEQGVTGTCVGHRDMACRIARINARKERKTHASTQKAAEKECRVLHMPSQCSTLGAGVSYTCSEDMAGVLTAIRAGRRCVC